VSVVICAATPATYRAKTGRSGAREAFSAVLAGRDGFQVNPDVSGIYGGTWQGPVFILTHHPGDAPYAEGVTILSCDVVEACRVALTAARGKNLEVFSASIGRQLLPLGLIDEITSTSRRCCSVTGSASTTTPGGSGPPRAAGW